MQDSRPACSEGEGWRGRSLHSCTELYFQLSFCGRLRQTSLESVGKGKERPLVYTVHNTLKSRGPEMGHRLSGAPQTLSSCQVSQRCCHALEAALFLIVFLWQTLADIPGRRTPLSHISLEDVDGSKKLGTSFILLYIFTSAKERCGRSTRLP